VLEVGEHEGRLGYRGDLAGAGGDVPEGAPALSEQGAFPVLVTDKLKPVVIEADRPSRGGTGSGWSTRRPAGSHRTRQGPGRRRIRAGVEAGVKFEAPAAPPSYPTLKSGTI
jgi:hypothetical protein